MNKCKILGQGDMKIENQPTRLKIFLPEFNFDLEHK